MDLFSEIFYLIGFPGSCVSRKRIRSSMNAEKEVVFTGLVFPIRKGRLSAAAQKFSAILAGIGKMIIRSSYRMYRSSI